MKVILLNYSQNAEKFVAAAAKLCYSDSEIFDLMDNLTEDKVNKFVSKLETYGHESPFEHVSYTFAIEGISRALSHQLVRHRIASFSQQSQRYVNMENFDYVIPDYILRDKEALETYNSLMSEIRYSYEKISMLLESDFKNRGLSDNEAKKKAIENARYVLPNACTTKIIVTMNARSLYNFFKLRCCNRAQEEIRDMAWEMLSLVKQVSPTLFKHSGPSCLYGRCSEGTMSCGKPYISE